MDGVDNGRPPDSAPPVKSVVSVNNHVRILHDMMSKKAFFTPLVFNISSSNLVVTNLALTKIGNCHIWIFSTLHRPSFFYISRHTSPKCYRTQTQTRQEVARMRGGDRRRMRRWWTRLISNQERTALLRTRCTSDPGRATPCVELRETSTWPNGDPLHLTTLTERVNPSQLTAKTLIIEAWRQDGQLSRIWGGLWLFSNY